MVAKRAGTLASRDRLINYGREYRKGHCISTARVESTVDQLVDCRMERKQHMRWTRRGAQMLLHARCALINERTGQTPGGRPQNHRWSRPWRHEPQFLSSPELSAVNGNSLRFKYSATHGVTYYNLVSNQFTGLNGIVVPGTLRDSLVLLAVVLEQQTELNPTEIMTDTGAYADVVFGLFWLLGYRFSPRIADMGNSRLWRIDPKADYSPLNGVSRHRINADLILQNWDDLLRLAGSLKQGLVQATSIMRTLQVGDRPTKLAQAVAEVGRIDKTIHILTSIDDEFKRRRTLTQLNRGEDRHSLARAVFHGKRGELRQRYREGQEDQLGALGLVVNILALWNTIYMDAVLEQLRIEGYALKPEDVARLSPLTFDHINFLGRYAFALPDSVAHGQLRPLWSPDAPEDE
jgi:TnpA family transposase